MKFLRLLAWGHRWRKRAIKAERQLIEVSAQAEAEVWRNREREDMFVSAAVMGGRGMVGISPRSGPAGLPDTHRLVAAPDPWQAVTRAERNEFEREWLVDAIQHGITPQQAQRDFMAELAKRKQFNDEPLH